MPPTDLAVPVGAAPSSAGQVEIRAPFDSLARASIEHDLDASLFVEAGAGSGKTSALVARIVRLVSSGAAELDELAAITFTEEAAAELRIRVRQALTEVVCDEARDLRERERAGLALDRIDDAAVSTIHGFCRRILAGHPIEAGLPPRFEVMDEVGQSLAWHDTWSEALDRYSGDDDACRLFAIAFRLGMTARQLEELASESGREWDRCGVNRPAVDAVVAAVDAAANQAADEMLKSLEAALSLATHCSDSGDGLLCKLRDLEPFMDELSGAEGPEDLLELIGKTGHSFKRLIGKKQSWACDVEEVRAHLRAAGALREALIDSVCDLLLPALVALFDLLAREAAAKRRALGRLAFHDLLVLARDLLREDEPVREAVRRQYTRLLVDEFQDTDGVQLEIIELIGGGEPGRLFFVGDPKQSIYRFRGADLESYHAAKRRLRGRDTIALASNFRSVPPILDFANECFSSLMPAYSELYAEREPATDGTPVHLVGGPLDSAMKRPEQREIESEACAAMVNRAVRTQRWLVGDGDRLRPARFSDVAILVPRRTGLAQIENHLDEQQIGFRVESASLIYRTQEVRDLLALCRAIDEPGNQVALLAALRSAAFACGDDDLVAFRRAGGHWSVEMPPEPVLEAALPGADPAEGEQPRPTGSGDASVVVAALQTLRSYRELRHELGAIGVLEYAVADRRILQLSAGSPRERECWRRVRFLVERARTFVAAGGGSLADFADWVEGQLAEGLRAVESVLPEPDEDVVHILTVHGAKGLEFPITVLAGFGTTDEWRVGSGVTLLRSAHGKVEVHIKVGLETAGFAALKADEEEHERAEAIRVLYVAVTRARDHLVVCGHHVPAKSTTQMPATGLGTAPPFPGFTDKSSLGQRLYEVAQSAGLRRPELFERVDLDVPYGAAAPALPPGQLSAGQLSAGQLSAGQLSAGGLSTILTGPAPRRGGRRPGAWPGPGQYALFDVVELSGDDAHVSLVGVAPSSAFVPLAPKPQASPYIPERERGVTSIAEYEAWVERRRRLLERIGRPASVRATDLGGLAGAGHRHQGPDTAVDPGARRGRGGTRIGRAVHATLQVISVRTAREIAAGICADSAELTLLAAAQAKAELIAESAGEVGRLVLAALSAPTVREAFASPSVRRELYVATTVGNMVLDGFVDLGFESEDGLVLVDYKTDALRDAAEVAEAGTRYSLQAAAYALALGDATGRQVDRAVLVFLSLPGNPIEYEVADLPGAIASVRELVALAR